MTDLLPVSAPWKVATLREHLCLGPAKCVSYLLIDTIEKNLEMTIEEYVYQVELRKLKHVNVAEEETCLRGGVIYTFSEPDLVAVLSDGAQVLERVSWPTDCEGFIRRIALEWIADDHPAKAIVNRAFGE